MTDLQTRAVDRHHYVDYLERAQQCLRAAQRSCDCGDYDACAINSVQSAISASDALSTFSLGLRNAGPRHDDAIKLFKSIDSASTTHRDNAVRLAHVLSVKNTSSYEEKPVRHNEARYVLLEAQRFLDYVKSKLPTRTR